MAADTDSPHERVDRPQQRLVMPSAMVVHEWCVAVAQLGIDCATIASGLNGLLVIEHPVAHGAGEGLPTGGSKKELTATIAVQAQWPSQLEHDDMHLETGDETEKLTTPAR